MNCNVCPYMPVWPDQTKIAAMRLLLLAVFLFGTLTAYGQLKSDVVHYSTRDGLSHDGVLCITRDREGFMWFGTFDGLNRFDGHNFVVYKSRPGDNSNLQSNKIRNIVEDKAGYLWVQTFDYKLYRFNKKTETFIPVSDGPYKSLFKDQVIINKIIPDNLDGVWLLTKGKGMFYVSNGTGGKPAITRYTQTGNGALTVPGINITVHVTAIEGNVWVGTEAGLSCLRRTGNTYKAIKINQAGSKGLLTLPYTCAAHTSSKLYFGTSEGKIVVYDIGSKQFSAVEIASGVRLNDICIARNGIIYVSTTGRGLVKLNAGDLRSPKFLSPGVTTYKSLYEDHYGNLWIEPELHGIVKYNPETGIYKTFNQKLDITALSRDYQVVTDASGVIWTSMKGGGFGYYDTATDDINYFYDQPGSPDQQFSNVVTSLYVDRTGVLWMSAKDGGINKIISLNNKFIFRQLALNPQNRSANEVRAMMKDSKGRLWLCTKDGYVHVYQQNKEVSIFTNHDRRIGFVYTVMEDSQGNVWLGTKGNGLFKASPLTADRTLYTLQNYTNNKDDDHSLSSNMVYSVLEDHKGRIWVGTFGGGLDLFTHSGNKDGFKNPLNTFHHYPMPWAKAIRHLCEDNSGHIWIATSYGLLIFNPDENSGQDDHFKAYQKVPGDPGSLGNNGVQYLCKDQAGQMWVGTFGGGLNKAIVHNNDVDHVKFKAFTKADGLPNDVVLSITADDQQDLWVATAGGLSRFNIRQQSFKTYDSFDGLPDVGFSEAACFTAANGELYFGCTNGYLSFYPQTIVHNRAPVQMALTNLQLYYKTILPGAENSPLQNAINQTASLTLSHDQNVISIDYAVLDYRAPNKVSYAYKLENFDKTWHLVNDLRKATYTNIPPGSYTLRVKGTNDDLFSNTPEKTLQIVIRPPFYLTWIAYVIYVVLAVLALMLARNITITMIGLRNKVIIEQKLTEMKLSFFTNISHELRTPLTLISSPLEELSHSEKLSARGEEYFRIINRNVNRMIRFTNQLLDLRKVQNDKMQISASETNLTELAKETGACFESVAAEKNISLLIETDNPVYAWVDEEKIEIIIYNLLSNAFKFSPPNTKIRLLIEDNPEDGIIELKVTDEGSGVPSDSLKDIFELYHEEHHGGENHLKGTGIGLALARGLALNHKGDLLARLNEGPGMTFILRLKAGYEHYTPAEISTADNGHTIQHLEVNENEHAYQFQMEETVAADAPLLLVVEDNNDLRAFLEMQLRDTYRVLTAKDGVEGLEAARSHYPDLIISDVVMPRMDGIRMMDTLKQDVNTSHIPVILLTAKSSVESRIKALQYGADVYLTKPFHNDLLLASVQNLLTSRKRLFARLAGIKKNQEEAPASDVVITTPKDEAFLKDVIRIVEEKMKDPNFNIDEVASGMGMGRTAFYKKLKGLSALSPVEFVRELRLKRSKELLDSGDYTVSEAGYLAGFNSLPYFSTCFKDKHQVSPSAYLKKNKTAEAI